MLNDYVIKTYFKSKILPILVIHEIPLIPPESEP